MKRYVKAERQLLTYDGPLPEPQVELSDDEIKVLLSHCIDAWISSKNIESIVRKAIYTYAHDVDWQSVYRQILRDMPEFQSPKGQDTILTYVGRK